VRPRIHGELLILGISVSESTSPKHATASTVKNVADVSQQSREPRSLLHDRDSVFTNVVTTIAGTNTQVVRTAPRSPSQNAHVERFIGSIRREYLDHMIVMNAAWLHRLLMEYVVYYLRSRTHLAQGKDHTDHASGRTAVGRHCRHTTSLAACTTATTALQRRGRPAGSK
jgi:transposase InsO family protein